MKKKYLLFLLPLFLISIFLLSGCDKNPKITGTSSSSSINAEYIFNDIGIKTGTFTVSSSTDIASSTAHGLKDGDMIVVASDNTLPSPLAAATVYYVKDATTNSFRFAAASPGDKIDLTDNGVSTSSWTMHDIGSDILVENFRNALLAFDTDGGGDAAFTVKIQGSVQTEVPDFSAAQTKSNQWEYIQIIDLEDGASIDGDTGVSVSGADDHRLFEINTNHLRWVNAIISSYTEGELTLQIKLKDND